MNAVLLKARPLSGEFEELYFDQNDEMISVKFEDDDYLEYCGVFGGGFGSYSNVIVLDGLAFVVSFGQGYIFDINTRAVVHKTKNDQLVFFDVSQANKYFICCSQTKLFIYNLNGLVWSSDRISSDGIEIIQINDIVFGKVFNFEKWVDFKLNLSTFDYQCEWICEVP